MLPLHALLPGLKLKLPMFRRPSSLSQAQVAAVLPSLSSRFDDRFVELTRRSSLPRLELTPPSPPCRRLPSSPCMRRCPTDLASPQPPCFNGPALPTGQSGLTSRPGMALPNFACRGLMARHVDRHGTPRKEFRVVPGRFVLGLGRAGRSVWTALASCSILFWVWLGLVRSKKTWALLSLLAWFDVHNI